MKSRPLRGSLSRPFKRFIMAFIVYCGATLQPFPHLFLVMFAFAFAYALYKGSGTRGEEFLARHRAIRVVAAGALIAPLLFIWPVITLHLLNALGSGLSSGAVGLFVLILSLIFTRRIGRSMLTLFWIVLAFYIHIPHYDLIPYLSFVLFTAILVWSGFFRDGVYRHHPLIAASFLTMTVVYPYFLTFYFGSDPAAVAGTLTNPAITRIYPAAPASMPCAEDRAVYDGCSKGDLIVLAENGHCSEANLSLYSDDVKRAGMTNEAGNSGIKSGLFDALIRNISEGILDPVLRNFRKVGGRNGVPIDHAPPRSNSAPPIRKIATTRYARGSHSIYLDCADSRLIAGGYDGSVSRIYLLDPASLAVNSSFPVPEVNRIHMIDYIRSKSLIALNEEDGPILLYDTRGRRISSSGGFDPVYFAFTESGTRLLSVSSRLGVRPGVFDEKTARFLVAPPWGLSSTGQTESSPDARETRSYPRFFMPEASFFLKDHLVAVAPLLGDEFHLFSTDTLAEKFAMKLDYGPRAFYLVPGTDIVITLSYFSGNLYVVDMKSSRVLVTAYIGRRGRTLVPSADRGYLTTVTATGGYRIDIAKLLAQASR